MFAALAKGRSRIRGLLDSDDVRSTADCLRRLGANIGDIAQEMVVEGHGASGLVDPAKDLDCGNSGTSARLLTGIVAGAGRTARLVGDASLSKRPMKRVTDPLAKMGAAFEFEAGDGLPMRIRGARLTSLDHTSLKASAQIKSALLLAGVTSGAAVTVREPHRSRDHTERMLAHLGVRITVNGTSVILAENSRGIDPFEFDVPGDPSSAAFFAAWSVLHRRTVRTTTVSLNPTRTGFFAALERAGATVDVESRGTTCGEPVGALTIRGALSGPMMISPDDIPGMIDELPLVACIAAVTPGETRVTGAQELRVKESDRITAVVTNLRAIGADADELPDGFVVRGTSKPLRGAVKTFDDHRIAMAFGVLASLPGNAITIDNPACASVSFPQFWNVLGELEAS
jgi:3-phosphoshikimate 1-carboxyvinyltransferase